MTPTFDVTVLLYIQLMEYIRDRLTNIKWIPYIGLSPVAWFPAKDWGWAERPVCCWNSCPPGAAAPLGGVASGQSSPHTSFSWLRNCSILAVSIGWLLGVAVFSLKHTQTYSHPMVRLDYSTPFTRDNVRISVWEEPAIIHALSNKVKPRWCLGFGDVRVILRLNIDDKISTVYSHAINNSFDGRCQF